MTGAIAAVVALGNQSGPGADDGDVSPTALAWNDIYDEDSGSTQIVIIEGISAPIHVSATKTGRAQLSYILNGNYLAYTGAFIARLNDTLGWAVVNTSILDQSGTINVSNANTSATLASFNYTIYSSRGGRL